MPHPPYSPALAWGDFFLFPRWKVLKAEHFDNAEEVGKKKTMAEALQGIRIDEFKNFRAVEKSLRRCIASNGKYFEGDWSLNM